MNNSNEPISPDVIYDEDIDFFVDNLNDWD